LVEMMGGEIGVSSEPNIGSTFTFTAWLGLSTEIEEEQLTILPDLRGMRVLVAEDNEVAQQVICELLTSLTFKPHGVGNGQEAVSAIENSLAGPDIEPFDFIIMDWKMPGMDGLEAAKIIKNITTISEPPPIILATSFSRDELLHSEQRDYIDGFLSKPLCQSMLFSEIMKIFGKEDSSRSKIKQYDKVRDYEAIQGILGAKVLLAEDNAFNQQVACELLESNGLDVTVVNNGREAVEAAKKSLFDVVLMDIQMPEMDGMQATAELRRDPLLKGLPILAMTAHAMAEDREKSLAGGMNDHITKPIDPDKLFEALVKWIPVKDRNSSSVSKKSPDAIKQPLLPDTLPGIDLKVALKNLSGNSKLLHKLLVEFYQDNRDTIPKIQTALKEEPQTAERMTHTLKGIAGSIGAAAMQSAALALETAINKKQSDRFAELLSDLEQSLTPILGGLEHLDNETATAPKANDEAESNTEVAPIDRDALTPLFAELNNFLKSGHSQSETKLAEIRTLLAGNFDNHMQSIQNQIEDYEYEEAMETLSEAASLFDIQIKS
jgi:two-component system, sensor histidine kinase and response regulator